jgi:hypothetical protein
MGEDTLKSDVHALEGVAQGVVESLKVMLAKVMLAKENLGYVGLGGSVVLKQNITGEVFQYELKVNPWGNEGWTVYVMIDCRIGGDDRFGPPEAVTKTGERDGRFVLPLEKEYRGDWTVDWVETGEIDSNFFQRFVSGCRPSMVLKCGLEHEVYRAWADAPWIIGYAVGPEVWKDLLGNWDEAMKAVTRGVILRLLSYGENCACRRKGKFDWWGGVPICTRHPGFTSSILMPIFEFISFKV